MGILSAFKALAALTVVIQQCAAFPINEESNPFLQLNIKREEHLEIARLALNRLRGRQSGGSEYDFLFETLTPSPTLNWVDCHGIFKCARLEVPLDYSEPSGAKAAVAVYMLPANPSVPFKGTIFSHPGGAGNPSVPFFLSAAQNIRDGVLGPGWNFVTWDARGAGQTTPTLTCFESNDERAGFSQRQRALPPLNKDTWETHKVFYEDYNQKCQSLSSEYIPHIGFIQTTRDLVSIADAMSVNKINLWGFSYGANIGAVLTTLHPTRVGRLVLDSVGKIEDRWAPGTSVEFELRDHDKLFEHWARACHFATASQCGFWYPTVAQIKSEYIKLETDLLTKPIQFASPPGNYTQEMFRGDTFAFISGVIAPPVFSWFVLGYLLAEVRDCLNGASPAPGGTLDLFYQTGWQPKPVSPPVDGRQQGSTDAQQGIPCTDSGPLASLSQKEFEKVFNRFIRKDPRWGPVFIAQYLACTEWTGVNVEQLDVSALDYRHDQTVHLISHNIDPLGPIEGAKSLSRKFRNSRVITIDGAGHTQLLGPTSLQAYIQVGTIFNNPAYQAARGLVVQINEDARPFGWDGTTLNY